MNSFHYGSVLLDMYYGIELPDEEFEEYGLIAWNLIGNKHTRLYRCKLCIDPKDNSVTLPCNAIGDNGCVELVTLAWEDWERVTDKHDYGNQNTSFVESIIEAEKVYQGPYYLPGKIVKYQQVGDKLYFTHNYGTVNILYKGYLADDEGLPEISDKEAMAIATYIAWIYKFKESLITNNKDVNNTTAILKNQWLQQCDQARITYLNQNDFDAILDASTSWGRHQYGKGGRIFK